MSFFGARIASAGAGLALAALGRHQEAVERHSQAIRLDPFVSPRIDERESTDARPIPNR